MFMESSLIHQHHYNTWMENKEDGSVLQLSLELIIMTSYVIHPSLIMDLIVGMLGSQEP